MYAHTLFAKYANFLKKNSSLHSLKWHSQEYFVGCIGVFKIDLIHLHVNIIVPLTDILVDND